MSLSREALLSLCERILARGGPHAESSIRSVLLTAQEVFSWEEVRLICRNRPAAGLLAELRAVPNYVPSHLKREPTASQREKSYFAGEPTETERELEALGRGVSSFSEPQRGAAKRELTAYQREPSSFSDQQARSGGDGEATDMGSRHNLANQSPRTDTRQRSEGRSLSVADNRNQPSQEQPSAPNSSSKVIAFPAVSPRRRKQLERIAAIDQGIAAGLGNEAIYKKVGGKKSTTLALIRERRAYADEEVRTG